MAQDRDSQDDKAPRAPLSTHSAFPLIVGLWFAALLGLGTIVMPAAVLEPIAAATGLTEAPLTATARAVIALLATVIGLVGGLALARRMADAQHIDRAPRRRAPRAGTVRPLSVHDDLGEEAIAPTGDDKRPTFPGRRRALAVIEDERPSEFLMAAPVPGHELAETPELSAPDLREDVMSERASDIELPAETDQPDNELDLSQLVAESPIYDPPAVLPPEGAQVFAPADKLADPQAYVPDLDTRKPRDLAAPPAPEFVADPAAPPAPIDGDLDDLGIVQLTERLGRSMQQLLAAKAEATPAVEAEPLEFSAPSLDEAEPEADALAVPPPVVPEALRAFMDVEPEQPAPAALAEEEPILVPPPVVPAALQPFAFEGFASDEEDEFDSGPFTLPLAAMPPRPFDAPFAPPADDDAVHAEFVDEDAEEADDALAADDGSFSSLLTMKNPFRAADEFVRIDEPAPEDGAVEPAVVFPGQEEPVATAPVAPEDVAPEGEAEAAELTRPFDAPHQPAPSTAPVRQRAAADPVETERALRSALANLQRMSGAA